MLRKQGLQGIYVLTGPTSTGGQGTSYYLTGWWTPWVIQGDRKTGLSLEEGAGLMQEGRVWKPAPSQT